MSQATTIRVLIADDHAIFRQGLATIINRDPEMQVIAQAENGEQAIALFGEYQPDVTLMDLRMPEVGGVTAIGAIRATAKSARIIVLTTYDSDEDIYRGLQAGAKGYLLKETEPDELLNAIRTVYRGQQYIPPDVGAKLAQRLSNPELSERELEVLRSLAQGMSNAEIAAALSIGEGTVKSHVNRILNKLDVSDRNLERIKALGGGIAIQHRMAFQGEYFINRYGQQAVERTPPIARMLEMDISVGAGTDATRVASYKPFVSLYWMVSGKTVGGTSMYPESNRLDRMEALRRYTVGSAWFSNEESKKGAIVPGQLADLAVLTDDYFNIPEEQIKHLESVLTIVGGKVVYAASPFDDLALPPLPVTPDWSPVNYYHQTPKTKVRLASAHLCSVNCCLHNCIQMAFRMMGKVKQHPISLNSTGSLADFWGTGCSCFAF